MRFEILGEIESVEAIAIKNSIRDILRLHRMYGGKRWRKLKGVALIRQNNGRIRRRSYTGMKCMASAGARSG